MVGIACPAWLSPEVAAEHLVRPFRRHRPSGGLRQVQPGIGEEGLEPVLAAEAPPESPLAGAGVTGRPPRRVASVLALARARHDPDGVFADRASSEGCQGRRRLVDETLELLG